MGQGKGPPENVLKTLDALSLRGRHHVDDSSDKLISHIFVYVLILFAIIAGIHEYSGSYVDCLSESKDGRISRFMAKHLNSFCLTQTLYYYDDFWKTKRLPPIEDHGASNDPTTPQSVTEASSPTTPSSPVSTEASSSAQTPRNPQTTVLGASPLSGENKEVTSIRTVSSEDQPQDQKITTPGFSQTTKPVLSGEYTSSTTLSSSETILPPPSSSDSQKVSSSTQDVSESKDLSTFSSMPTEELPSSTQKSSTVSERDKFVTSSWIPTETLISSTQASSATPKSNDFSTLSSSPTEDLVSSTQKSSAVLEGKDFATRISIPTKELISSTQKSPTVLEGRDFATLSSTLTEELVSSTKTSSATSESKDFVTLSSIQTDFVARTQTSSAVLEGKDFATHSSTPTEELPSSTKTSSTESPGIVGTTSSGSEDGAEVTTVRQLPHETSHPVLTSGGEIMYANEITHMITVVFVLQAIFLKLPQILWREILAQTGCNVQTVIKQLTDEQFQDTEKRRSAIAKFASIFPKALSSDTTRLVEEGGERERGGGGGGGGRGLVAFCQGKIFWLYMVIKVLYIVVLLFQFWLLSAFFGFHFLEFGPSLIRTNILRQPTSYITDFPSVVLCNFRSPTMSIPREGVWVQCVMVFNDFLKNMLLIEWVGLVVMGIVTLLSIFMWMYWRWNDLTSLSFIYNLMEANLQPVRLLPASEVHTSEEELPGRGDKIETSFEDWEKELKNMKKVTRFVRGFLSSDGVFLLRIIHANTNQVVMSELTRELYKIFCLYEARVA